MCPSPIPTPNLSLFLEIDKGTLLAEQSQCEVKQLGSWGHALQTGPVLAAVSPEAKDGPCSVPSP